MKDIKKDKVVPMKHDQHTRLSLLEQSTNNIGETLKDIRSEMREMRSEMKGMRSDLTSRVNSLANDVNQAEMRIIDRISANNKWIITVFITTFFGLIGTTLSIAKFFIN